MHAHVVEREGIAYGAEEPMDDSSCDLHSGINGLAYRATNGVPALVVIPGDELGPAVFNKVHARRGRGGEGRRVTQGTKGKRLGKRGWGFCTWWRGSGTRGRIRG